MVAFHTLIADLQDWDNHNYHNLFTKIIIS